MALYIVATLLAFFVKGLSGFANTLVFTSVLAFGTTNINISPVELLLGYPTNIILAWNNRRKLNRKVYAPLALLVLAGSVVGAFLLKNTDPKLIKIVFGITIILLGIEMILREMQKLRAKESKALLAAIGIISGVLCGLFGVGALLAAYIGRVTDNSEAFKANISAVFIIENTFRVILYAALGIITFPAIRQAVVLMPFMLIGLLLGIKSAKLLDEKIVKRIVAVLLILSGAAMLAVAIS